MEWGLLAAGSLWVDPIEIIVGWPREFAKRWADFAEWFEGLRKTVEPVTWVVGSILALVPGSFALYKWIYYRYSRLPERLDDMLEKEEQRLRQAREHLLTLIERPTPIRTPTAPIFVVPSLGRAMRTLKWSRWRRGKSLASADENLESALADIENQLQYWDKKHDNYYRQKATAYLLRGAIAAAHATKKRASGMDGDQHNRLALGYFQQALEIDPTDCQALEYVAHQQRLIGMLDEALASYQRLHELANGQQPEVALLDMRALRHRGEILWTKYAQTSVGLRLTEAKDCLEAALRRMPTIARDDLDHAFVLRFLTAVEWKRGTQLWSNHLLKAEGIFLNLIHRKKNIKDATAGLADVKKLREEIESQITLSTNGDGAPGLQLQPPGADAPPNFH